MAALPGSQWSKNPLLDRQNDERAIDCEIADTLETIALKLRSRQSRRLLLAQATAALADAHEDAPPLERKSA